MNVLLISREYPPYEKGGICRIAVYLAKYADRYGVNLTIIANHPLLGIATEKVNSTIIYRVPSLGKTFLTQMPSFGYYASRMVDKIQDDYDVLYSIESHRQLSRVENLAEGCHSYLEACPSKSMSVSILFNPSR